MDVESFAVILAGVLAILFGLFLKKALIYYPPLLIIGEEIVEFYDVEFYNVRDDGFLELFLKDGRIVSVHGKDADACLEKISEYGHLFNIKEIG